MSKVRFEINVILKKIEGLIELLKRINILYGYN